MTKCIGLKQPYNLKTSRFRTLPSRPTGVFTTNRPTALTQFPILKSSKRLIASQTDLLWKTMTVNRSTARSRCRNILKSLAPKWGHSSNSLWERNTWNQKHNPLFSALNNSWESLLVLIINQSSSIPVPVQCIWLWSMPPINILKAKP